MDLEGFTRRRILSGYDEGKIVAELAEAIKEFKNWNLKKREEFSKAVYDEVITALKYKKLKDKFLKNLIEYPRANVTMGEFGVGSRGAGDFFVHHKLAEIIGKTGALVDAMQQDDAGVVQVSSRYVTVAIDGMHSRLSEFPFLAGFHAARAALRDVYVMGSSPVAMISDLHLGDDGDIGKLFDFTAGAAAVGELTKTPLVSGSTLRIGGDMVFGDRLVAAVGAVGASSELPKARKNAEVGDAILMSEGAGGGTITTIALYSGYFRVIKETLNVEFMLACEKLLRSNLLRHVHAMSDVTNGGLRGDAKEISEISGKKLVFHEEILEKTVNKKVLRMLRELDIDHLGISTDSLMLILPEEYAGKVKKAAKFYEVGYVEKGKGAKILGKREYDFKPMFRESAYTKIKKVIGEKAPKNAEKMQGCIEKARSRAIKKKNYVLKFIGG
ncbi:MAG: AIR synthase related protein [Methanobacteriota archaeon]